MNVNFNMNPPSTNSAKYKTVLCKHYETSKGCAFKEKCQFAHGTQELRSSGGYVGQSSSSITKTVTTGTDSGKKGPNPQNYKIVKCKYWEKDGTCRYGTLCTFAHGDQEIRTKSDNMMMGQPSPGTYDLMGMNANMMGGNQQYLDPNFPSAPNMNMNPFVMGFDPNMMMTMQNMMAGYSQDPNLMNMNQIPNNFFMNYPSGGNLSSNNSGNGNNTTGN